MQRAGALRGLLASRGFRGVSTLAGSSVIAQALTLGATPLLSRLYPPEAFGYLTLVVAVTGMITPVIALRLESAILLPKTSEEASALLAVGLACAALVGFASVGVLELLFGMGLLGAMAELPAFSWWVGGISVLSGVFVLLGQYALRAHQYKAVGVRNITQSAITALCQLALALYAVSGLALVTGHALGRAGGVLPLALAVRPSLARFSRHSVREVARRYRRFPLLFAPAALLNAGALALPIICAGLWFDVADAGQWGMADRILALPIVVVAAALGQVVEARLAQQIRDGLTGSAAYYRRVSWMLASFSAIVGVVVALAAPAVVPFFLGPAWEDAAVIMQLLVPMLVTRIIAGPMSKALIVAQWAAANLWLDCGRAVLIGAVLALCWLSDASLHELVAWTALAFAAVYAVTWVVGLAAARQLDILAEGRAAAD